MDEKSRGGLENFSKWEMKIFRVGDEKFSIGAGKKFGAGHEIFGEGAGNFGVGHRDFGVGAEKKLWSRR